jgi:preprotein translocase subunit SecE
LAKAKATSKSAVGQDSIPGKAIEYFRSTRSELRKVVWPTRDEAVNLTIIVLAVTISMTLLLGGIDYIFGVVLNFILQMAA